MDAADTSAQHNPKWEIFFDECRNQGGLIED
jgi:hypothetical protein